MSVTPQTNFPSIMPVAARKKEFIVSSFILRENGLEPIGTPTKEEWDDCGKYLYQSNEYIHFCIGDWLNYGEMHWGDTYKDLALQTGFNIQTLRDDKWVASHIEVSRRRDTLSFSHHREVSKLSEEEQEELLNRAEKQNLTRDDLRKIVQKQTMQDAPKPQPKASPSIPLDNDITKESETIIAMTNDLLYRIQEFSWHAVSKTDRTKITKPLRELEIKIGAILMRDEEDNE